MSLLPAAVQCEISQNLTLVTQASGNLGNAIVPALLQAGFAVSTISRPGSKGYNGPKSDGVASMHVAYDNENELGTALQGHDAVVETLNLAAAEHQRTIVRAAIAAGVKHLITNEFGMDTFNPNMDKLPAARAKLEAQDALEDELRKATTSGASVSLIWTGIITGPWYDWTIRAGISWLDPRKCTITRYGSGDQKVSISRFALNGEAAVAVLREPDRFRNRPAYFASHTVSTNELIDMVRKVAPEKSWSIIDVPDVNGLMQEGLRLWDEDTKNGVGDRLHSQAFVVSVTAAIFDEENRFGCNMGEKQESGWDEGRAKLKQHLKELIEDATKLEKRQRVSSS